MSQRDKGLIPGSGFYRTRLCRGECLEEEFRFEMTLFTQLGLGKHTAPIIPVLVTSANHNGERRRPLENRRSVTCGHRACLQKSPADDEREVFSQGDFCIVGRA